MTKTNLTIESTREGECMSCDGLIADGIMSQDEHCRFTPPNTTGWEEEINKEIRLILCDIVGDKVIKYMQNYVTKQIQTAKREVVEDAKAVLKSQLGNITYSEIIDVFETRLKQENLEEGI